MAVITYVTDLIKKEYITWNKKLVMIQSPTGAGKNTFIVKELLPYMKEIGKKGLILINRCLLKCQADESILEVSADYHDMLDVVDVLTYQAAAMEAYKIGARDFFCSYDFIVCDEAHYFYADADFGGSRAFFLFQELVYYACAKMVIFMSSTPDPVFKMIKEAFAEARGVKVDEYRDCLVYGNPDMIDTDRFSCYGAYDMETIVSKLLDGGKKGLIFYDNKREAESIRDIAVKKCGLKPCEVKTLSSESRNLDDPFIQRMTHAGVLDCRLLITTSVLDNGVSLKDSNISGVAIITDSRVSFVQMLGRVRGEAVENLALYFYLRPANYYHDRLLKGQEEIEWLNAKRSVKGDFVCGRDKYPLLLSGWEKNDADENMLYRKYYAMVPEDTKIFTKGIHKEGRPFAYGTRGNTDVIIVLNDFAVRKLEDSVFWYSKFWNAAVKDPADVARMQMAWIGKNGSRLVVLESTVDEEKRAELREYLLTIKGFSNKDFVNAKTEIVRKYSKLFPDIDTHNGSMNEDKFKLLCESLGLTYKKINDNGMVYSVEEAEESAENTD